MKEHNILDKKIEYKPVMDVNEIKDEINKNFYSFIEKELNTEIALFEIGITDDSNIKIKVNILKEFYEKYKEYS